MNLIKDIYSKAKKNFSIIVLPEASVSERVLNAGLTAAKNGLAKIIFIGGDDLKKYETNNIKVVDINNYENYDILKNQLYEKRKHKGLTLDEADKLLKDPIYFGTMLVECGYADGLVAGAVSETARVLRPALQIIKGEDGIKTVSCTTILTGKKINNKASAIVLSDPALVEKPTAEQLADIAIASAKTCRSVLELEPVVAFLSYTSISKKENETNLLIKKAMQILKERNVDFVFDGELQVDAALDPTVAKLKAPESKVLGNANCLIFPDIVSGNIGYKLMQRGGELQVIGPITQGLKKPVNDLSRGATVEEIIICIALTAGAKENKK